MWDLVENDEDRFSHNEAQIIARYLIYLKQLASDLRILLNILFGHLQ